jgi:hypothetical protein
MRNDVQSAKAATQINLVLGIVIWSEAFRIKSDSAMRGHLIKQLV